MEHFAAGNFYEDPKNSKQIFTANDADFPSERDVFSLKFKGEAMSRCWLPGRIFTTKIGGRKWDSQFEMCLMSLKKSFVFSSTKVEIILSTNVVAKWKMLLSTNVSYLFFIEIVVARNKNGSQHFQSLHLPIWSMSISRPQ